jgi:hypothetical protein
MAKQFEEMLKRATVTYHDYLEICRKSEQEHADYENGCLVEPQSHKFGFKK